MSEQSYQRYAKFYGQLVLKDTEYIKKLKTIYNLIVNQKKESIIEIAQLSKCTEEESILKIRYLKNKRKIGDYYIDYENKCIFPCSKEDQKLLQKYKVYIYRNHYQIDEIAVRLPGSTLENLESIKQQVFQELEYLDKKGLLNGIKLDPIDQKIIYYSIEKHKKEKDMVSINCENCGALNDVNRGGKVRCEYCGSIIEGPPKRSWQRH